ncbi:MAG: hypothetical protein Q7S73_00565 [bacterium]|nr:hypothetical protein [bacterium]
MKIISWEEIPNGLVFDLYIETEKGMMREINLAQLSRLGNILLIFECSQNRIGEDGEQKILANFTIAKNEIEVLRFDNASLFNMDTVILRMPIG